jgi:hypothetical protein
MKSPCLFQIEHSKMMAASDPAPLSEYRTILKRVSAFTDWRPRTLETIKKNGHDGNIYRY